MADRERGSDPGTDLQLKAEKVGRSLQDGALRFRRKAGELAKRADAEVEVRRAEFKGTLEEVAEYRQLTKERRSRMLALALAFPGPFGALGLLYSTVKGALMMFVAWWVTMAVVVALAAPKVMEATTSFNVFKLTGTTLRLVANFAGRAAVGAAIGPIQFVLAALVFLVAFAVIFSPLIVGQCVWAWKATTKRNQAAELAYEERKAARLASAAEPTAALEAGTN